jgi:hypothetical protein
MSHPAVSAPAAVLAHRAFDRPPVHNQLHPGRRKGVHSLRSARRARDQAAARDANAIRELPLDAARNEITLSIALQARDAGRAFQQERAVLGKLRDGTLKPLVVARGCSAVRHPDTDGAPVGRVGYEFELDGRRSPGLEVHRSRASVASRARRHRNRCSRCTACCSAA